MLNPINQKRCDIINAMENEIYPPIAKTSASMVQESSTEKTSFLLSGGQYFLSEPATDKIPSGYYETVYVGGRGPGLKSFPKPSCDEWIAVRGELFGKVFNDLSKFREAKERYKKLGYHGNVE